jgi:multiple sugar transport system ATP-binding protein
VAIGRALVREAPVFLFDEPLSNLDAQLRAELRVEIKRLHRRIGATMIYVTHDQIEALTLADRIAVMQGGKIQQLDTPQVIYARPASRFVAAFVGSPAMNFLNGRVGGGRFAGDDFALPLPGAADDGRPVVLGIRPEHVLLGNGGAGGLTAAVEMVEPMGADSLVWCRLGGASLSARVSGQARIAPGQSLPVSLPAEHISLFDETSGDRLPFHIS